MGAISANVGDGLTHSVMGIAVQACGAPPSRGDEPVASLSARSVPFFDALHASSASELSTRVTDAIAVSLRKIIVTVMMRRLFETRYPLERPRVGQSLSMLIDAIVDSEIRIPRSHLSSAQLQALEAALSYENPAFNSVSKKFSRRMQIPPTLSTLRENEGIVIVPRGALAHVVGLGINVERRQLVLPPVGFRFVGSLRDYQQPAVAAAVRAENGVVVAPCGAGKTTIALGIIARVGQPALVLVSSLDLVAQWAERVDAHLGVACARFAGGRFEIGPITVATVQSARDATRLDALRGRFGLVLLDECHHAPAQTFATVMGAFPARHRLGVTATPTRADGLEALIAHYIGPIVHVVETSALVDAGHLVRPVYVTRTTNFHFAYRGPDDWHPLVEALVSSPERNTLIVDTIAKECVDGIVGLALTGRVAHAEELRNLLIKRGMRVAAMTSDASKNERLDALSRARSGEIDIIVATQLADEGLDVPRLARMFLCFPSKSATQLLQRVGRIMRPHASKAGPEVIDFVDTRVGVLANQAQKRALAFASLMET
jgi:superfamily II DNA or RNA helicase